MPPPAVALRIKKFRRRFGIAAPRVVIRSHIPWQWLVLPGFLLALLLLAIAWVIFQRDEVGALGREMDGLERQLQAQKEELILLRSTAGTGQSAVSIERAAQQQLIARIDGLERENAALKEDMLLFERLIPVAGEEALVRIENFRVLKESVGRHSYRLLLAFQPSKQNPEFHGKLQLLVSYWLGGREQQLLLPAKDSVASEYLLDIKHFLRREGVVELPPGARLKSIEARVLHGDTLKSKRLAHL